MALQADPYILLVEDDTEIRDFLAEFLKEEGFNVQTAINGQDALTIMRSAAVLPRIVLLDLMMPIMDGKQFREEQQKDTRMAKIPVIVLSADEMVKGKSAAIDADAFLRKPIPIEELLREIQRFWGAPSN